MAVQAYFGVQISRWGKIIIDPRYVFVDYTYNFGATGQQALLARDMVQGYHAIEAAGYPSTGLRPLDRSWREQGAERFVVEVDGMTGVFSQLGETGMAAGLSQPDRVMQVIGNDLNLPAQAELPLLENVIPDADPALAAKGDELMLLYTRDTGATHPVQFTEVAWTRYDGMSWSAPAAVAPAANGQFAPQVVFDGNGDALAVWEQFNDPAFNEGDLEETASHIEVMWSRWNATTGVWTAPAAMTSNVAVDHQPKLAGPLANGDVVLTWIRNQGNKLAGEGVAGAATNNQVMTTRWDAATKTWLPEQSLVSNLTGDTSHSLAAAGAKAIFLWGRDIDGNIADTTDTELFYRVMDAAGAWGEETRLTNDTVPDLHARVAVDAAGEIYVVWNRDGNLVMQRNLAGEITAVHEDSGSLGAADFSLALGPAGNLLVVWQDMVEAGSDIHYQVFDPESDTWGLSTRLSNDRDLETAFAPVWDANGNLTLAYLNVAIVDETKTVTLEDGSTVTVDNVPQPGRVDLLVAKRRLLKDLALAPGSIKADGTDFLPGDTVTLKAWVRNTGTSAVENVAVGFYDGDPADGGTRIGTATVPGWLRAADEAEVELPWTIPAPALARTVHIVVDPDDAVSEADETNNSLALPINGVDLAVEYRSGSVLPDGSVRVVAKVRNLSAPASPVSVLRLKAWDGGGTLAETTVSQLAPGQSVEIPIHLPEGTHPPGDRAYSLVVDEEGFAEDIDLENNEALFSLWLDGSVSFAEWLAAAGVPPGQDGPLDDADGDGITNLAAYVFNLLPGSYTAEDYASALPRIGLTGEGAETTATLTYRHYQHATGVNVVLEASTTLEEGLWEEVSPDEAEDIGVDPRTGDPIRQLRIQTGEGDRRFLRLRFDLLP